MKKIILTLSLAVLILFSFTGCNGSLFLKDSEILNIENPKGVIYLKVYNEENDKDFISERAFSFELFYKSAPNTVTNFINLVNSGYYNEKTFELSDPFVEFGVREFVEEVDEDDDTSVSYDRKIVDKDYYIAGEFPNNKWDYNKIDKNVKIESGIGSMMMIRDINSANPSSKYNTAYAAFRVQTAVSNVKYEEDYCVFGKLTGLSSAEIEQQLVDNFFEIGISDAYDGVTYQYKFMISRITIETPSVTEFPKPKTIKIK